MNSRFFFGPPNTRLAQRSGSRIRPIGLPSGVNTLTPSSSSALAAAEPLLPQPHHRLPSVSTLNPSSAPGPLASTSFVLLDTVNPSAPTSQAQITRFGCARDSMTYSFFSSGENARPLGPLSSALTSPSLPSGAMR